MIKVPIRIWLLLFLPLVTGCGGPPAQLSAEDRGQDEKQERAASGATSSELTSDASRSARMRSFRFHYRFSVSGLEPGRTVRVWLPVPTSSSDQQVEPLAYQLPVEPSFHTEPKYDNRILYFATSAPKSGEFLVDVPYHIQRREILALKSDDRDATSRKLTQRQRRLFLQASAKVPVQGKPLLLLSRIPLSNNVPELARQLYDLVDRHVTYKKVGTGWGNGDVLWVCESRYGNCTDFHSLFLSLARSQGVPARFEIGFSIPTDAKHGKVGGYHCWAFFHTDERGWIPVDISEADKHPSLKDYYFGSLTPDRVTFSVGRDIALVPKSQEGPLNFFVYPHVEVDGTPLPRKQITLQFSYVDADE